MIYEVSKTIQPGHVCTLRGNKLCRASRRTKKVLGVWVNENPYTILVPSTGEVVRGTLPEGLCTRGVCYPSIAL